MSDKKIQAIETHYKGYKFRSRTEARWAVFFDAMGIRWEYEIEGFNLSGVRYLPDFWIPSWDAWVEIKGGTPTASEQDKCHLLAKATEKRTLMFSGQPNDNEFYGGYSGLLFGKDVWGEKAWLNSYTEGQFVNIKLQDCRRCDEVWAVSPKNDYGFVLGMPEINNGEPPCDNDKSAETERIINALAKAKQARFEYGESG
jgi:hypothetical protein